MTTSALALPTGSFAAFRVRHFGLVWLSGLLWHLCRWGVAFVGTYLVNDLTGSPRLVQLAGTTLYAPLLVGGIIGGVVSDRFDRLNTVRLQMAILAPLTVVIGLIVRAGAVQLWMLYLYMFAMGMRPPEGSMSGIPQVYATEPPASQQCAPTISRTQTTRSSTRCPDV